MTGPVLLVWFVLTVLLALLAWARAEVKGSPATWLPPLLVLVASGAALTCATHI